MDRGAGLTYRRSGEGALSWGRNGFLAPSMRSRWLDSLDTLPLASRSTLFSVATMGRSCSSTRRTTGSSSTGRRSVRRFNDRYQRTGTLWEGRFRSTVVDSDEYVLACYRYIDLNPVRGGLADDPGRYPWSSYRANALGARDLLVSPHECYAALGRSSNERQIAYRDVCHDALPDAILREIRDATRRGWALGTRRFRDEVASLLARRTQPATRGRRPRKKDEIRL